MVIENHPLIYPISKLYHWDGVLLLSLPQCLSGWWCNVPILKMMEWKSMGIIIYPFFMKWKVIKFHGLKPPTNYAKKHMFTCLRFQCFSDDEDVRSILVLPITKLICWITMVNLFRWNHPGNHCNHVSEGKSRTTNSSNTLWLFVTSPLENHHAINR